MPHKKRNSKEYKRFFNKEVKRYLQHDDFVEKEILSLNKFLDEINDHDNAGYDPTASTLNEDDAFFQLIFNTLITDISKIDVNMGKTILLLFQGFSKGEIIEILNLTKGKTQNYVFVEKAVKTALKIYLEKYS